jgi:hypothetical protein
MMIGTVRVAVSDVRNLDHLRSQIDQEETLDNVIYPDLPTAPPGTYAEAGGHSATGEELSIQGQAQILGGTPPNWPREGLATAVYIAAVTVVSACFFAVVAMG